MEIIDAEIIPLTVDLDVCYGSAKGARSRRAAALVKLTTDNGITGWGEAFAPPAAGRALFEELLVDEILGTSPYRALSLCDRMYADAYQFSTGPMFQAGISGIDIACWDILGKAHGEPIHRLLGGPNRDAVLPYASTFYFTEESQDASTIIGSAVDNGFTAAKIKLGRGIEEDIEKVSATRAVLDDGFLMVDYNGNYRAKQALESIREIEPYDIHWAEEPVPPENASGYRTLQRHCEIPLTAGEAHYSRFAFKELIDNQLVDIVQPNVTRCGGFSEAMLIGRLATTENLRVCPHIWNSAIGLAASLQFAFAIPAYPHSSATPDYIPFEYDRGVNPLRSDLVTESFLPNEDGLVTPPNGPGLGINIDTDAVERYRIRNS